MRQNVRYRKKQSSKICAVAIRHHYLPSHQSQLFKETKKICNKAVRGNCKSEHELLNRN